MSSAQVQHPPSSRVLGLDALRFVLATWVVLGHTGFIPVTISKSTLVGRVAVAIYNNLFNGPAAVIVFFVISGFCIHYPFRSSKPQIVPYYSRRYARILTPMIVAIGLSELLGSRLTLFHDSILWSLLCEEIYYALYPALAWLGRRAGWKILVAAAMTTAYSLVVLSPHAGNYPSYGPYLNWVLGLPCWLLGCLLAESVQKAGASTSSVWWWRASAMGISMGLKVLRFHSPITYPWTLNLFALFAVFWLRQEIATYRTREPSKFLEWGGKWSYSLYLVHVPSLMFLDRLLPRDGTILTWATRSVLVYSACYIFYLLVEKPSHTAARQIGEHLSRRALARVVPNQDPAGLDDSGSRPLQTAQVTGAGPAVSRHG